jgi:phage shock protein PspC (stress-responsive transcriptional regulator)
MDDIRHSLARQGITRSRNDRVLGGVCAGLGRRVGIDPWPARLIVLVLMIVVPGSPLLIYPVLWYLMPQDGVGAGGSYGPQTPGHW